MVARGGGAPVSQTGWPDTSAASSFRLTRQAVIRGRGVSKRGSTRRSSARGVAPEAIISGCTALGRSTRSTLMPVTVSEDVTRRAGHAQSGKLARYGAARRADLREVLARESLAFSPRIDVERTFFSYPPGPRVGCVTSDFPLSSELGVPLLCPTRTFGLRQSSNAPFVSTSRLTHHSPFMDHARCSASRSKRQERSSTSDRPVQGSDPTTHFM